jgi:branched-chain amino acid transport system substrate-binding protein
MKKSGLAAIAILALVAATVWYWRASSAGNSDLVIGGIYALTGKAASFGKEVKNGADLAADEVNRVGGVGGKKLVIQPEDTQSEPKYAVAAFERLLSAYRIPAAIGFITSSEALACVPVAERAHVLMITPIAGTPKLRGAGRFVFRTRESGEEQARQVAEYVFSTAGIHRAAVLCETAANSAGYRAMFVDEFTKLGGSIVADLSYDESESDFRPLLTRLKALAPPAIYIPGVGTVIGRILRQASDLKLKAQYYSSAGIEDPELFAIAGDSATGVIYGAPAFSITDRASTTANFVAAYSRRFGEPPSPYAANSYDAVHLLAAALVDGQDGEGLRRRLLAVQDYSGASGLITFDEFGEVRKRSVLKRVRNGRFEILE